MRWIFVFFLWLLIVAFFAALLSGCTPLPPSSSPSSPNGGGCAVYAGHHYQTPFVPKYSFRPDYMTLDGIQVDTSGVYLPNEIGAPGDLVSGGGGGPSARASAAMQTLTMLIDMQIDDVEQCLRDAFLENHPGSGPGQGGVQGVLDAATISGAHCDGSTFPLPIARGCLNVKVAPDAMISADGTQEVLPATGPAAICISKGLCPAGATDLECPCHVRAGIQDNAVIVVTPSAYLLKDPLIRMVTGCNNPWIGALAKCAAPSVPALSGLVMKREP